MNEMPSRRPTEGEFIQIKKIGNSAWSHLARKTLLARLELKEGDKLHIVEQTEAGFKLCPTIPKHRQDDGNRSTLDSCTSTADTLRGACKMNEPMLS